MLLDALLAELAVAGIDPMRWARAWARLIPSLVLIPALGLPAFPLGLRLAFAALLGASVAPSLVPATPAGLGHGSAPLLVILGSELARGVPAALGVALCVWGASMAGHLIDELRGGASVTRSPFDGEPNATPFGVLLSLAAALAFLQLGGPARLCEALAVAPPLGEQDLPGMARLLAHGVQFAVVLAGPLLALVPFVKLVQALVARAAYPVALHALLTPLEALLLLGFSALLLDRLATGVVLWLDRALPPS